MIQKSIIFNDAEHRFLNVRAGRGGDRRSEKAGQVDGFERQLVIPCLVIVGMRNGIVMVRKKIDYRNFIIQLLMLIKVLE